MAIDTFKETETYRSKLDLVAFVGAFLAGFALYVILHLIFKLHQNYVVVAIICVMLAYSFLVIRIPRLRVRMDQAGDNAYYLGLLFTLMSMAFALYEFGVAHGGTGVKQIIANFGIALASTIVGIFLRVTLHQMRIDPADVERMTRIDLAEASKHVRAILDNVTNDLSRFHDEIQQRSTDVVTTLLQNLEKNTINMNRELEHTSKEMVISVGEVQREVLNQTQELSKRIGETASEAMGAIERLRALEPPTVSLSRRFDKVGKILEVAGDHTERIASYFQETASAVTIAVGEISKTSTMLSELTTQMRVEQTEVMHIITSSAENVKTALDSVGKRLEQDRTLLAQLEDQVIRSVDESGRAQTAALEVLKNLTEVTRGLTTILRDNNKR